ncbi:MAG: integrase arm-type DNA-binding domain-containing protein [Gammaproteobacteria bacterium]|nr:integrase arm-type DNA-binding domain-containing protein [Gammaproteobacteria bacterium]
MLTDTAARQAKPKEKPYRLSDEKGLYLEVHPNGSKYWRMKYRYGGKEKRLAFGVYPEVSLKRARGRRSDARDLLVDGVDPSEAKRADKLRTKTLGANSFGAIAQEWFERERPHWSESHTTRVKRIVEKDLAALNARPIAEITAPDLLTTLRRVEARGAIDTAHRAKQTAGQVFRYAVATGRAERDPSRDLEGALARPIKTHRAAIVDPTELGTVLKVLDGYQGTLVVRAAIRLAPLVFVRPGELRHMEWAELNLEDGVWLIPGSTMKTGSDHIVPLATQSIAIIEEIEPLTSRSRYVFPSARSTHRPMSDNAVLAAFRRMGIPKEELSGHGFRATARTILAEVLEYPAHLIEHQLAHSVRDANGQAYNRTTFLKQRREMMQRWADYLDTLKAENLGLNTPSGVSGK